MDGLSNGTVAMATSLKQRAIGKKHKVKYLPHGENLVKISPVDLEIAFLKGSFKNKF